VLQLAVKRNKAFVNPFKVDRLEPGIGVQVIAPKIHFRQSEWEEVGALTRCQKPSPEL